MGTAGHHPVAAREIGADGRFTEPFVGDGAARFAREIGAETPQTT
jgi:hypothetical protein